MPSTSAVNLRIPRLDFSGSGDAQVLPGENKSNHGPVIASLRLPTEDDIRDAALWRLETWPDDAIDAGSARLAKMLEKGVSLDSAVPEVAAMLANLPLDRRSPWSGLMALAVLHADAHVDQSLFFRAGMELMTSYRQAIHSTAARSGDVLSRKIREYIVEMPDITPEALWKDFTHQAQEGWGGFIIESTGDSLSYEELEGGPLQDISRSAFRRRVQRIKREMRHQQADVAARELG